ncbi:hypothetical protein UK82_07295 [Frankia sp. ACN1ag]|nr:hypothetical protein UK82_07295 [Frankia sp. ACN1ag]
MRPDRTPAHRPPRQSRLPHTLLTRKESHMARRKITPHPGNQVIVSNGGPCTVCGQHATTHIDGTWIHETCIPAFVNYCSGQ